TAADPQPSTPPRNLFHQRERGVSIRVAEPLGRTLLAFADLPPVDDEVVIVRDAIDLYGTERVLFETHLASAPPGSDPTIPQAQNFLRRRFGLGTFATPRAGSRGGRHT